MEEITFSINTNQMNVDQFNASIINKSKRKDNYYEYKIENSTLLRSSMKEKDFALVYGVVLLNHLFKQLIPEEMRSVYKQGLIFSSNLDIYDNDKTVAELIFCFSLSNREYEMLMTEFEYLIEKYGFKSKANHIFLYQLIEVIDIKELNDGIYEFEITQ